MIAKGGGVKCNTKESLQKGGLSRTDLTDNSGKRALRNGHVDVGQRGRLWRPLERTS